MLVSQVNPAWLKFGTFVVLLPLILIQAVGYRRPIKSERSVGLAFGSGVGVLYAVTTISGPPLAVMLSNQGFTKQDFRAALGLIRLAESSLTAVAYYYAGLYTAESFALIPYILPSIVIGVPLGGYLIQHIRPEVFRRVCMSFDAWVVAYGLSALLKELGLVPSNAAYLLLVAVALLDLVILYRFFAVQVPLLKQAEAWLRPPRPRQTASARASLRPLSSRAGVSRHTRDAGSAARRPSSLASAMRQCRTSAASCARIAWPALVGWMPSQNRNSSAWLTGERRDIGRDARRRHGGQTKRRGVRDNRVQELIGIKPREADSREPS